MSLADSRGRSRRVRQRLERARRRLVKAFRVLKDGDRFRGTIWCLWNSTEFSRWAKETDRKLWEETLEISTHIYEDAAKAIVGLPITGGQPGVIGGGGCDVRKLYFLARHRKPKVIVETGVSAGYSSRAFLEAIRANGIGRLYSSDLPLHLTREQVGCIVPPSMRNDWELYYDGDAKNIPLILATVPRVDLFHYDSEKSVDAKRRVIGLIRQKMPVNGLIVVDDIDRDGYFRELSSHSPQDSMVFRNVGVIGIQSGSQVGAAREE